MAGGDPRIKALRRFAVSITAFNVLGFVWLGFEQSYAAPVVSVLAAYGAEALLESCDALAAGRRPRYAGRPRDVVNFFLPAHITGLACSMLLYANSRLWPVAFASTMAIASKYVVRARIRGRVRHVLNPSNIGITLVLMLFPWVGIAPPYEFTEWADGTARWIIPAVIVVSGTLLNLQLTKRMPLILAWLGTFAAQALVRTWIFGAHLQTELLPMTGTAFVLFTNYMITDPGTSPSSTWRQVGFGASVAATYGFLVQEHVVFGLFFSLGIVSCIRAVLLLARAAADRTTPAPATPPAVRPAAEPELVLAGQSGS